MTTESSTVTMDCLPPEVIRIILMKLPTLFEVFKFMRVNKTWYEEGSSVVSRRGMQLIETTRFQRQEVRCCDAEHTTNGSLSILEVDGKKLEWPAMEYILKKMGNGLQVLNVFEHCQNATICVGDFNPNLECLRVEELRPPFKPLHQLKHLYVEHYYEDILHPLNELFPCLEVMELSNASITNSTLDHLKNLPKLKKVFIGVASSNGLSIEAIQEFRTEMSQSNGKTEFDFKIGAFDQRVSW